MEHVAKSKVMILKSVKVKKKLKSRIWILSLNYFLKNTKKKLTGHGYFLFFLSELFTYKKSL